MREFSEISKLLAVRSEAICATPGPLTLKVSCVWAYVIQEPRAAKKSTITGLSDGQPLCSAANQNRPPPSIYDLIAGQSLVAKLTAARPHEPGVYPAKTTRHSVRRDTSSLR